MFVNANLNSLHTLKYERSLISARSNEKCPVYSLRRISEIFCGVSFEVFGPPSQSDVCLSRPLSKARQMTSIPVAAANDDHTRGPLGDEELNVIRATKIPCTHVISDCPSALPPVHRTALELTRLGIGNWELGIIGRIEYPSAVEKFEFKSKRSLLICLPRPPTPHTVVSLRLTLLTPQPLQSFTCIPRGIRRALCFVNEAVMRYLLPIHHAGHQPVIQSLIQRHP